MADHIILISDAAQTCGVEEFARQTARHMGNAAAMVPLNGAGADMQRAGARDIVINLPVVAWKRRLLAPLIVAARARLGGRGVTVVLHEWADLALARRISYLPLLPLATRVLFSSPEVMAQFDSTPVSSVVTKARGVMPIPPNFPVPDWTMESERSQALASLRATGTFVLGQFGSIYPRKDPFVLLEVAAELVRRGIDLRVVVIGSFIGEGVEAEFRGNVTRLGLDEVVDVTGYVGSAEEIYGLFDQVDAFLYPLSEGLTSRRASVLAAALSGRPVVVTAPVRADSLDHHPVFKSLLRNGTVRLTPRSTGVASLADAVMATRGAPAAIIDVDREVEAVWATVTRILEA